MPPTAISKKATKAGSVRKMPLPVDYQDQVTDEHLKLIKAAAEPKGKKKVRVLSGPAW